MKKKYQHPNIKLINGVHTLPRPTHTNTDSIQLKYVHAWDVHNLPFPDTIPIQIDTTMIQCDIIPMIS